MESERALGDGGVSGWELLAGAPLQVLVEANITLIGNDDKTEELAEEPPELRFEGREEKIESWLQASPENPLVWMTERLRAFDELGIPPESADWENEAELTSLQLPSGVEIVSLSVVRRGHNDGNGKR